MSFMNPVDMVEEDAADLQFPKVGLPDPPQSTTSSPSLSTDEESHLSASRSTPSLDRQSNSSDVVIVKPNSKTKYVTAYYNPRALEKATKLSTDQSTSVTSSAEVCEICRSDLKEPYIKCPDCQVLLCVHCFAQGREKTPHRNTHAYIVVRDDIQVFPGAGGWTAREERLLLNSLETSGYGNWEAAAKALRWQRSPEECRQHYHDCYFGGIFERVLGLTHASETYFPERMPYVMKMRSVDPPRHDDISSIQFKIMAGYRCARGDFDTPYDMSAESILSVIQEDVSSLDVDEETRNIIEQLQCALVRAYNHRLKERQRRYKIMRDNGLIMTNRTHGWISKYAEALGSEANCTRFLAFLQICDPVEFDKLVESMKYFTELQKSLFRLYELRRNGVRTLAGGALYFKWKKKRLMEQRERSKNDRYRQMYDWRKLVPSSKQNSLTSLALSANIPLNTRKKAGPMDIIGLPGYAKLTDDERTLCSVARIVPQNFLDYKIILIAENSKIGHLRLADARRLIKIDVNKTRQIYDFLIEHGHINKPT